jgi:2,3-bisphosphoglycerate-independent phosphoglycerate mutase
MKYAIILPDGAADEPLPQLAGRTPLEVARLPNMDWIAQHGRLGRLVTCPARYIPGTDVGTLTVFGYDPDIYYTGRAPIEAAAKGLQAGPDELIFRCNFVTIADGVLRDYTGGHTTDAEAERLIADLNRWFAGERCKFHVGVQYRNLMIAGGAAEFDLQPSCTPPHTIPNPPGAGHRARGRGSARVLDLMDRARPLLRDHEVNRLRREQDRPPVTDIWLWGEGPPARLDPFVERFGLRGAMITAVDIIRGQALLMGMDLIAVPGATGLPDTDYAAKGRYAVAALDQYDLVAVHIEAPDEAAHSGDWRTKIEALERIDELVVGPVLEALRRHAHWRILVAPDHPTPCTTMAHSSEPPPFCMAGRGIAAVERRPFSEREALAGGWLLERGYELMGLFCRA